jgi:hypothetical protein
MGALSWCRVSGRAHQCRTLPDTRARRWSKLLIGVNSNGPYRSMISVAASAVIGAGTRREQLTMPAITQWTRTLPGPKVPDARRKSGPGALDLPRLGAHRATNSPVELNFAWLGALGFSEAGSSQSRLPGPGSWAHDEKVGLKELDLRRFSGEGLAHSAAIFSNCAGLVKSRAEWRRTGL